MWEVSRGLRSPYPVKRDEIDFYYFVQYKQKGTFQMNCGCEYLYIKRKKKKRISKLYHQRSQWYGLRCKKKLLGFQILTKKQAENAAQLSGIVYFSVFFPDMAKESPCYGVILLSP